jgi:hypothetical protein
LEGAMVCSGCLGKIEGEIFLKNWAIDPRSDQRSLGCRSACLRTRPTSKGEVVVSKGSDTYLLLQRTLQAEDRSHLPTVLDQYLDGLGLGLFLMGDEMLPTRPVLKDLMSIPDQVDYQGEKWGRALLRLGNLMALSARDTSNLPLGDEGRKQAFAQRAAVAMGLYQRAEAIKETEAIAKGNLAMLRNWGGEREVALQELKVLASTSEGAALQLAKAYHDLGMEDEAAEAVIGTIDIEAAILRLRRGYQ